MRKLFSIIFLLVCLAIVAMPASAQLVVKPDPFGNAAAPIDQNGWHSFKIGLTANIPNFQFQGIPTPAQGEVNLIITQDAVGGHTIAFHPWTSPSGQVISIVNACVPGVTPNSTTICVFAFDGTNNTWYGLTSAFSPGADLTGNSTQQQVVGWHFGTNPVSLSNVAQTGCLQIVGGIVVGNGTNCPQPTGTFPGPFMVYDAQQYNSTPFSFGTAQEIGSVTCTGGTTACTLASALHFTTGENVVLYTGGSLPTSPTPAAPTATPIGVTGTNTLHYNCTSIDNLGGLVGGSTVTITNAPAVFGNPQIVISSISQSSGTVTVNATGVNAVAGETASISGVTGAGLGFNGFWLITVGGTNSFQYSLAGNAGAGTVSGSSFAQLVNSHNITAITRDASGVLHITTDAAHNFVASSGVPNIVIITGTTQDMQGEYPILTASGSSITAQSSIFTAETGTVTTGSTIATVHPKITVSCPTISGTTQNYAVYSDSPSQGTGSVVYIAETMYGLHTIDDIGHFLMSSPQQRNYMPSTPLASGVKQAQIQGNKICAGGGTTSLTMCNNVTQSVTSVGLVHDEGQGINSAASTTASNGGGSVYLSPTGTQFCQYPINYPVNLPQFVDLILGCNVLGNEPVTRSGYNHIYNVFSNAGANQNGAQFPTAAHYVSWFGNAKEFIHGNAADAASVTDGVMFFSFVNNQNFLVLDGGTGGYDRVLNSAFQGANATSSANDVGITYIGLSTGASQHWMENISSNFLGPLGQGGLVGTVPGIMSFTPLIPAIWIRAGDGGGANLLPAQFYLEGMNTISGRGILVDQSTCSNCTGQNFHFDRDWNQGAVTPFVTFLGNGIGGGITTANIEVGQVLNDSACIAIFANFANLNGPVTLNEDTNGCANLVTGNVTPSLTVWARQGALGQNVDFIDFPSSNAGNSSRLSISTPAYTLDQFGNVTVNNLTLNGNVLSPLRIQNGSALDTVYVDPFSNLVSNAIPVGSRQVAADSFSVSNSINGSNWFIEGGAFTSGSGIVQGNSGGINSVYWNGPGANFGGAQYATATINTLPGGSILGPGVNMAGQVVNNGAANYYACFAIAGGTPIEIVKANPLANNYSAIATSTTQPAAGEVLTLVSIPNAAGTAQQLTCSVNGVSVVSFTDSSNPLFGGSPGIVSNASAGTLSGWSAGSFDVASRSLSNAGVTAAGGDIAPLQTSAITVAQFAPALTSSAVSQTTAASPVAAGQTLVAVGWDTLAGTNDATVYDSQNDPWRRVISLNGGADYEMWIAPCVPANASLTVTMASITSQVRTLYVWKLSNVNCTNPVDIASIAVAAVGTATTSFTSPAFSTISGNEAVLAFYTPFSGAGTCTAGGGYTLNANAGTICTMNQVFTSPQTGVNTSMTYTNSTGTVTITAAMRAAPVLGSPSLPWSAYLQDANAQAYQTSTNCAAIGSAASPSIAACSAAPAGHFSCATNASGATCQVNTTAVTATSEILIFESDTSATGTLLGVTCNTSTNVLPASRLLASQTAGSGFTINLGTVTTNPACFGYLIVN